MPSMLYLIQNSDCDFYARKAYDKRQVLMGLLCPELVAVFFDSEGNLLEVQKRALPFKLKRMGEDGPFDIYDGRIPEQLLQWQKAMGFRPATIRVKMFFLPEQGIGIEDLPNHFREFLEDPSNFDKEEREYYPGLINEWKKEESFVLWWAKDYYMNKEGEIEST